MRIVHVVQTLGIGGQERLILNLSRELARRGHEPMVVSLTPGGELRSEFSGIPVIDVPRGDGLDPLALGRVASALSRLAPDAVHTHNPAAMFYAIPPARALGVRRRVHTKHGANIYKSRGVLAARVVVRMLTALVAVSRETGDVARTKERAPARLVHVIPNGIPLAQFGPNDETRAAVRAELGIPNGAFVIGTVGRLAPEKEYTTLVRAAAPLLKDDVRLLIVGGGESRSAIEAAIAELGEERARFVHLTGSRRDVPRLLAAMDLFTLTSRTEGLPLVVPEAMASGLPIVATAVGGLPSVVPETVGTLVPYGDRDALTRAYSSFASNRASSRRMGEVARAIALATYSIEAMTDRYEALYS